MRRIVKFAESLPVFVVSIAALLAVGVLNMTGVKLSDATQATAVARMELYTLIQAVFYLGALRLLTDVTPHLLSRVRPAVNISDDGFAMFARRVVGNQTRHLFALLPPVMAVLWLLSLSERLVRDNLLGGRPVLHALTNAPLPFIAVLFGLVSLWRMWGLMQLAQQPLHISLFDAGNTLPFGQLSSLYSALVMAGEMLHLFLLGAPNVGAWLITGFSTVASLIALLLPLWAVHRQVVGLKERTLKSITAKITGHLQTFVADEHTDVAAATGPIVALNNMRTMVLSASTWPISSVFSTARSLIVPFLPILYVLAQNLILPYFKTFLKAMGVSTE